MDKEIELFVKYIYDETGINFKVIGEAERTDKPKITVSEKENKTYFTFRLNYKTYTGVLWGTSEAEEKYATLIGVISKSYSSYENYGGKQEFFRALMLGKINVSQTEINAKKFSIGNICGYVAVIYFQKEASAEILNFLEAYTGVGDEIVFIDKGEVALFKNTGGEDGDGISSQYAKVLAQAIYEETEINVEIGIGGEIKNIYEMNSSYSQATASIRLARLLKDKGNVFAYREYVYYKILEDIPKIRVEEYLSMITSGNSVEIFNDKEMIETADEFFKNDLNLSETARKLFLHRNTLTYRLDKIENLTGLDIRKFDDAVTFKSALILYNLNRKKQTKN